MRHRLSLLASARQLRESVGDRRRLCVTPERLAIADARFGIAMLIVGILPARQSASQLTFLLGSQKSLDCPSAGKPTHSTVPPDGLTDARPTGFRIAGLEELVERLAA